VSQAVSTGLPSTAAGIAQDAPPPLEYWQDVRRRFFRNRTAVLGLVMLAVLLGIALIGPLVLRSDYRSARSGLELQRLGSDGGLLGTDSLGRNIAHRVVRGLGISIRLAAAVALGTTFLGMVLGGLAGFLGGRTDAIISRFIDALYAIPYVLIGFAAIAIFGSGFRTVFLSLLVTGWLATARIFRSSVLQIRNQDYIEAARATGADTKRIMLSHVLPNALPPLLVAFAFALAGAILTETIYSFLGIGFIEPTPSIGVMIRDARTNFQSYPHLLLVPASVLITLTLSIIFIGDGLRDALDPKLRGAD
jgi:oligopeptide transport system permease protein